MRVTAMVELDGRSYMATDEHRTGIVTNAKTMKDAGWRLSMCLDMLGLELAKLIWADKQLVLTAGEVAGENLSGQGDLNPFALGGK